MIKGINKDIKNLSNKLITIEINRKEYHKRKLLYKKKTIRDKDKNSKEKKTNYNNNYKDDMLYIPPDKELKQESVHLTTTTSLDCCYYKNEKEKLSSYIKKYFKDTGMYPETQKNYVFWSNVVQAYFLHSEHKTLKVEDAYSTHTTPHFHPYEWNKLVFHGLYKTPRYYKYFYINNLINDPIEFKHIREATDATLSSINFFSNGYQDGEYNQWAAGYYRGLRIWRGDQANAPLTIQYDNYFIND